jgi:hypothetical protein
MENIKKITNILALCTIVGLSCWVGYLLSANDSKARAIEYYKDVDSVNKANIEVHKLDSITISQMPPVEYLDFLKSQNK